MFVLPVLMQVFGVGKKMCRELMDGFFHRIEWVDFAGQYSEFE